MKNLKSSKRGAKLKEQPENCIFKFFTFLRLDDDCKRSGISKWECSECTGAKLEKFPLQKLGKFGIFLLNALFFHLSLP